MTLAAGTRIGSYEVVGQLGTGGMGEVYRAIDTALKREVAIKVLPESFAGDADRIARFEQEAKTLASLNHANIARIYGLEKADGGTAIVMEFVEGQTLADRIAQGPIPVDEAMGIAMQVMNALESAHGRQIVHRDLKPANIVLRLDGSVAVLDFGIAKAFQPLPGPPGHESPVMTTPVTQIGVILGTAAYMSPEQARGKFVDQRADIWAFGCVLFEMLTGQSAFGGEDVPITLARVLAQDTKMDSLPAMISPAVRQTLRLCLEKDPKQRIADIRDVRLAFQGAFETVAPPAPGAAASARWRRAAAATAAVLLATGTGLSVWWLEPEPPRPLTRALISDAAAPFVPIAFDVNLAVSPDGSQVTYRGQVDAETRLFLRRLDSLEATPMTGPMTEIRGLFFSPAGNWIGFVEGQGLYRISIDGGPAIPIVGTLDGPSRGATWGPDDSVVFATAGPSGLQRVSLGGGTEPEPLTSPDEGEDHWWPAFLPGGEALLFTVVSDQGGQNAGRIAVLRLGDSEPRVLVPVGSSPRYVESGHIVYAVDNTLRAVGFDLDRLAVTTDPVPVVDDVHMTSMGASSFAVSNTGHLVYASGDAVTGLTELAFINRDGDAEALPFPPDTYSTPRLSRDMTRVAVSVQNQDIWIGDIRRGAWNRVTTTPGVDNVPEWTPDDQGVVFASMREGTGLFSFYRSRADGSGAAVKLLAAKVAGNFKSIEWTADGTRFLFDYGPPASLDIGLATVGEVDDWAPLFESDDTLEAAPSLSRGNDWLAYASDRTGRCEVYAERFPDLGDRILISPNGGAEPLWSPTRDELYYRVGNRLVAVGFDPQAGLDPGDPELIADGLPLGQCALRGYDVSSDGERFLFARPVESADGAGPGMDLVLVQNWLDELERLVPGD
jgi:serine/threonine-protein kinase